MSVKMGSRDKIEKLEELIAGSIEGELIDQKVTSLLPPGENYGSIMYKVDFRVKSGTVEKDYHAVAKCTPLNKVTQEFFNTQETFKAEIGWYTTVIPTLKSFAKDQGLERDVNFFQKLYGARISLDGDSTFVDLDGVILTENLKKKGYYNVDRHEGFDAPTTYSILKDLATFHALPLAIRVKNRALYEEKLKPYCTTLVPNKDAEAGFHHSILEALDTIPELSSHMELIRKNVKESSKLDKKLIREPWVSIVHNDFWCNNIMITGGKHSKNIILDLQTPNEGSPAGEVVFFILTSVQLSVAKEQFDKFVKFYYDQLIENLEGLNVDTNAYQFDDFLAEIVTEMKNAQYVHALGHTMIIFQEKGTTFFDSSDADFKEGQFEHIKWIPNKKQIEKFKWISLEAIQRNWLK